MTPDGPELVERRPGPLSWLWAGLEWRWRLIFRPKIERLFGVRESPWLRVQMDREIERYVRALDCPSLSALEISGRQWDKHGFGSYRSVEYPEYDVCEGPLERGAFDVIFLEQVLEHVLWPYRVVRNVWTMLKPGGVFVVATPFLVRVHNHPVDCCRWTEVGMRHLLAEGGFHLEDVTTGSWGNRACAKANFSRWRKWVPWLHSLRNEPDYPLVVWAFARKAR
jgi:SAM-dependent methyltransferase